MNKEIKVGLFAIISGAILYLGFNYLKGIDFFSPINKFYAVYNKVDGLNVSNPVIVNGYAVGRVSKIGLLQDNSNKIIVSIDVSDEIIIGKGTKATLVNSDFMGSKAILLTIGDISQPLNHGDTLISEIDKGLEAILEQAQPLTVNIGTTISRINEILTGMKGAGEKINESLDELKYTLRASRTFMHNTDDNLAKAVSNTNVLINNVNSKVNMLTPILSDADSTINKIKALELEATLTHLNKTLSELQLVVQSINEGQGTLGKLINEDSVYNNLNKTLLDLDKLLIHFDENPKHFMSPLGKSKKKIAKERN